MRVQAPELLAAQPDMGELIQAALELGCQQMLRIRTAVVLPAWRPHQQSVVDWRWLSA
jgi:hypothetical protein